MASYKCVVRSKIGQSIDNPEPMKDGWASIELELEQCPKVGEHVAISCNAWIVKAVIHVKGYHTPTLYIEHDPVVLEIVEFLFDRNH